MTNDLQTTKWQQLRNFGAGVAIIIWSPAILVVLATYACFRLVERLGAFAYSLKEERSNG